MLSDERSVKGCSDISLLKCKRMPSRKIILQRLRPTDLCRVGDYKGIDVFSVSSRLRPSVDFLIECFYCPLHVFYKSLFVEVVNPGVTIRFDAAAKYLKDRLGARL